MADRAIGPYLSRWERINHDEDDAADRRAGECWDGLGTVGCSREAQAYPAPHPDSATRNFFGYRSADNTTLSYNAIRSLWGIRKSIGSVTAPSVGSFSWPSVGVTNGV